MSVWHRQPGPPLAHEVLRHATLGNARTAGLAGSLGALKPGHKPSKQIEDKVAGAIENLIGKIARPKNIWIVADMPKTRSGKIMRRVIAGISNFTSPGDITTLANPEIVESIKHHVQSEKVNRGQMPRELTPAELEEIKAFGKAE